MLKCREKEEEAERLVDVVWWDGGSMETIFSCSTKRDRTQCLLVGRSVPRLLEHSTGDNTVSSLATWQALSVSC